MEDSGVKTKKVPMTRGVVERRKRALKRLETQLKSQPENVRIKSEIEILKTRIR